MQPYTTCCYFCLVFWPRSTTWNWLWRSSFYARSLNSQFKLLILEDLHSSYTLYLKANVSNFTARCWQASFTLEATEESANLATLRRDFCSCADTKKLVGKVLLRCSCTISRCLEMREEAELAEGEREYLSAPWQSPLFLPLLLLQQWGLTKLQLLLVWNLLALAKLPKCPAALFLHFSPSERGSSPSMVEIGLWPSWS